MIYCHWHDIWTTARRNSPRKPLRAVERCGREVILGATVGYVWGTALPYLTARGPTIAYLENNKKSRISVLAEKHFDGLQGGPADSTTPFAGDSLFFCNSLCNARLWSHPHLRAGPFAYRICGGFCTRFCAPISSAVRQKVILAWLPHRTSAVRSPWNARLWSHPHLRAGPFAYRICYGFCTRFCAPNSSAVRQKVIPAWLPHRTSAVRLPWSEESRVSALLRC